MNPVRERLREVIDGLDPLVPKERVFAVLDQLLVTTEDLMERVREAERRAKEAEWRLDRAKGLLKIINVATTNGGEASMKHEE